MSVYVLKFDSAGLGHCFYTEELDLAAIGTLEISRASTIEFNPNTRQWEVLDLDNKTFSQILAGLCVWIGNINTSTNERKLYEKQNHTSELLCLGCRDY